MLIPQRRSNFFQEIPLYRDISVWREKRSQKSVFLTSCDARIIGPVQVSIRMWQVRYVVPNIIKPSGEQCLDLDLYVYYKASVHMYTLGLVSPSLHNEFLNFSEKTFLFICRVIDITRWRVFKFIYSLTASRYRLVPIMFFKLFNDKFQRKRVCSNKWRMPRNTCSSIYPRKRILAWWLFCFLFCLCIALLYNTTNAYMRT